MTSYTYEKAVEICSRKLEHKHKNEVTCYDCYYYDGGCELNHDYGGVLCSDYMGDVTWSNIVRDNILNDLDWCKENFNMFCSVDKELFIAIYR